MYISKDYHGSQSAEELSSREVGRRPTMQEGDRINFRFVNRLYSLLTIYNIHIR